MAKKRLSKAKIKECIQKHHLRYGKDEIVLPIRRKVHYVITLLQRYKNFTETEKLAIMYVLIEKPILKIDEILEEREAQILKEIERGIK